MTTMTRRTTRGLRGSCALCVQQSSDASRRYVDAAVRHCGVAATQRRVRRYNRATDWTHNDIAARGGMEMRRCHAMAP
ncbi:MAG: hypothetical protein D6744_14775 [Planctomycetota bacterium]|nr:MAG: hypothetical protein D6744_14775 [Planctomycetota bacterium]